MENKKLSLGDKVELLFSVGKNSIESHINGLEGIVDSSELISSKENNKGLYEAHALEFLGKSPDYLSKRVYEIAPIISSSQDNEEAAFWKVVDKKRSGKDLAKMALDRGSYGSALYAVSKTEYNPLSKENAGFKDIQRSSLSVIVSKLNRGVSIGEAFDRSKLIYTPSIQEIVTRRCTDGVNPSLTGTYFITSDGKAINKSGLKNNIGPGSSGGIGGKGILP